ncbi:proteasome subunit beta, partial [archaeon]|nr:proteasome subunit beta [archaeon]
GSFAFGVFDAQYKPDLKQEDAVKLAVTAINSALQRDSASGDGIDVVVINKDGVKKVFSKELFIKVSK